MWNAQRIAALLIVAFWLTMMALLVNRETAVSALPPSGAPLTGPAETWMRVLLPGGRQAGYIHYTEAPESRRGAPGRHLTVQSRAVLNLLGQPSEIALWGEAWHAVDGDQAEFDLRLRAAEHSLRAQGDVAGGRLDATLHTGGETIPVVLPVPADFRFAVAGMGAVPDLSALEPGDETHVESFSPASLTLTKSTVRLLRREPIHIMGAAVQADVVELVSDGMKSVAWLSAAGEMLRVETALGFSLERCRKSEALLETTPADTADLMKLASIVPAGAAPFAGARRMRVRLSGVDEDIQLVAGPSQRPLGPGEWLVEPVRPEGEPGVLADPTAWLASTAFVQSAHPRIAEQAAVIVGDAQDPWEKARRIYDWVYANIAKVPVASLPSALEVLETRQGDCNEHTVLFAALARAAGIPTEIAVGVVWSEDYQAFYYHAWPEVYVGQWVWMDPTLGQEIADATHLKLLAGGIEQWVRLAPFLTRLNIDVREIG